MIGKILWENPNVYCSHISLLELLNSHNYGVQSHLVGATSVLMKNAIKCSSMKSGIFPFALNSPQWGGKGVLLLLTQIVAQCMNNHP